MTLDWLFGWWNLLFLAPFFVALLYLGVYTLTGIGGGDGDAGGDHEVEADADADVDSDAEAEADPGHSGEHLTGGGAAHPHSAEGRGGASGPLAIALNWLGVGRAPLSLLLIVLMLTWGAAGFLVNSAFRPTAGWEAAKFSIPIAVIAGVMVTKAVSGAIGRFVPLNDTAALRRRALVGTVGEALYDITPAFGVAVVRDPNHDLQQVACRVGEGVETIPKGTRVKLVAYSEAEKSFFVALADDAPVGRQAVG